MTKLTLTIETENGRDGLLGALKALFENVKAGHYMATKDKPAAWRSSGCGFYEAGEIRTDEDIQKKVNEGWGIE
jgi:hypothetical protein